MGIRGKEGMEKERFDVELLYACHDLCRKDCWMDTQCRHECISRKCQVYETASTFCFEQSHVFYEWLNCLHDRFPEKEEWKKITEMRNERQSQLE